MSNIEVYRNDIRDLDSIESVEKGSEYAVAEYEDEIATNVLSDLARSTEEQKIAAMNLPIGSISHLNHQMALEC